MFPLAVICESVEIYPVELMFPLDVMFPVTSTPDETFKLPVKVEVPSAWI